MAAHAAARFARLKNTLNMKHWMIVASVNTVRNKNKMKPSVNSRIPPAYSIKHTTARMIHWLQTA